MTRSVRCGRLPETAKRWVRSPYSVKPTRRATCVAIEPLNESYGASLPILEGFGSLGIPFCRSLQLMAHCERLTQSWDNRLMTRAGKTLRTDPPAGQPMRTPSGFLMVP
jgi:hypothetical protein